MDTRFERAFVEYVKEQAALKYKNHTEFARKAFPDASDSIRIWRKIRNEEMLAESRRVSLTEAYAMSAALGMEFPNIIWQVDQLLKTKQAG
ncbi:MAG TPA: hypothetical protein DCS48_07335 [Desulfovibrio sp.]|nr:hypothetical protein [Desulfovibrio sp.]